LEYYLSNSGITYDKPQGKISLYDVTKIKELNANEFQLVTPKRTFELKCNSFDEQEKWLRKIKLRVSPNVPYQSWLWKKGEKSRGWKKRYCKLCEYDLHYEVRYYEDENCTKYKGLINCNRITDVKVLNDSSIKKYGKSECLEIITDHRSYIVSAMDKKTRNLWYKQLKAVLNGTAIQNGDRDKWDGAKDAETVENAKLFDIAQQSMTKHTTTNGNDPLSAISPKSPLTAAVLSDRTSDRGNDEQFPFPETGSVQKSKSIFVENALSPRSDLQYELSPEPFMERQKDIEPDSKREHPKDPSTINMDSMVDILETTKIRGIDDDEEDNAVSPATSTSTNGSVTKKKSPFEIINGSEASRSETNPFLPGISGHSGISGSLIGDSRTSTQRGASTSYTMTGFTASSTSSMDTPVPASMRHAGLDSILSQDSMYSDIHSSTSRLGRTISPFTNDVTAQRSLTSKTESVVHSESFLKRDHEDPEYRLMGDTESHAAAQSSAQNKCCVVL